MVKGQNRRIVVVRGTGRHLFEEAIFILRENAGKEEGYSAEDLVREAEMTAQEYLKGSSGRQYMRKLLPVVCGTAGMAVGVMLRMLIGW